MQLLGLHGLPQSGKDTLAKRLVEQHGFTRIAFADPMRNALYTLNPTILVPMAIVHKFKLAREVQSLVGYEQAAVSLRTLIDAAGWDSAKVEVEEVRNQLRIFGTEIGRQMLGENVWVELAKRAIRLVMRQVGDNARIVITDVRFPNEVGFVQINEGKLVKITSHRQQKPSKHASDVPLPDNNFARIIENNGTIEELHSQADAIAQDEEFFLVHHAAA